MDPRRIALWRYGQIEELLDETLGRAQRRGLLRRMSHVPVRWPSGQERPLSEATLYRWLRRYRAGGLEALQPAPHLPSEKRRQEERKEKQLEREILEYAVDLLREDPERSLTLLIELIKIGKDTTVSRSTLHRRIKRHPAYPRLRELRKQARRLQQRRRFQARAPHDIWQCDSKGPFEVTLSDGRRVRVHIFTILDDFSRATLAFLVTEKADLKAAVAVFCAAARRWGLPRRFYADRASIFDSAAFRAGLALLGVHRIRSKARNAAARGKIEAYHRILKNWFIRELRHQVVHDLEHLARLLTAVLECVYMNRRHRGIKKAPREALGESLSNRLVSSDRLTEAFLVRKRKKAHPKTGEVELGGTLFKVSSDLRGKRLDFAYDPVDCQVAFVELPSGSRRRLEPAVELSSDDMQPPVEKRGPGRLQALYDHWMGRSLPQAEAGFGLPEIFALLSEHLHREVPRDEFEAASIEAFYGKNGPFSRQAFQSALRKVISLLGAGRALLSYLDALSAQITPHS